MARAIFVLNGTYQQIAAGKCVITAQEGGKSYYFNESATDTAALVDNLAKNEQIIQNEAKATWAKAPLGGSVIVDEV